MTTKKSQIIKAAHESNLMQQIEVILYDNLHQGQYDTDLPIYGVLESAEKILEWHNTLATEVREETLKEVETKIERLEFWTFPSYLQPFVYLGAVRAILEQLQSQGEK